MKKRKTQSRGHMTGRHYSNESIYQPTDSSTAERGTTVKPTKRCIHPPFITAVQQKTYTAVLLIAVKPPWVQKTKIRNTSNTQSHEHTRPSTYSPTNRPHPLIQTELQWYWDFHVFTIIRPPGSEQTLPREAPAAESFIGGRFFAGKSSDCCLEKA